MKVKSYDAPFEHPDSEFNEVSILSYMADCAWVMQGMLSNIEHGYLIQTDWVDYNFLFDKEGNKIIFTIPGVFSNGEQSEGLYAWDDLVSLVCEAFEYEQTGSQF